MLPLFHAVKAEDGSMSREGIVANTMRQIHSALSGGAPSGLKMIHVTNHTHCFKLQEAMILAEVCAEFHQQSPPLKQVKVVQGFCIYTYVAMYIFHTVAF